jgi:hypothetical protein
MAALALLLDDTGNVSVEGDYLVGLPRMIVFRKCNIRWSNCMSCYLAGKGCCPGGEQ